MYLSIHLYMYTLYIEYTCIYVYVCMTNAGVSKVDALVHFHLAPLSVRRDIAMLGLIHRAVLGKGTPHFQKHFPLASRSLRKIVEPRTFLRHPIIKRSVFGLVAVYNFLPSHVVACGSVH